MHGLQIPEIDDPWVQRADRLPASVSGPPGSTCAGPKKCRRADPADEQGPFAGQALHRRARPEPPQSLARQAQRVLDIEDEMTSGFNRAGHPGPAWWPACRPTDDACACQRGDYSRGHLVLDVQHPLRLAGQRLRRLRPCSVVVVLTCDGPCSSAGGQLVLHFFGPAHVDPGDHSTDAAAGRRAAPTGRRSPDL